MRPRSKAREIALCSFYQAEISKIAPYSALENYLKNYPQPQEIVNFASVLVEGVHKNINSLDQIIKKYVENWEIERLAIIDKNILRMGIYELLFLEEIPPKVSINEAIELAKKFGDIDSARFVNGVLDRIYKKESKKYKDEKS
ncbi:MAG: hypothetical protein B6D55_01940 [Candidatus Omnitrophica bacterium 4484_70.2]|nr:MAG: hypothetical protein B6D55_01940 [Candidatus Omnitrophica bacterium 4484_70.2]